jgi:hypothetical protein
MMAISLIIMIRCNVANSINVLINQYSIPVVKTKNRRLSSFNSVFSEKFQTSIPLTCLNWASVINFFSKGLELLVLQRIHIIF